MKIKDLQTGAIHEYGTNVHDSLYVSMDGRTLSYYNLQNGDGSRLGDYRFVCDDEKVPAESETAEARHAEVYFNIGGWHHEGTQGEWIPVTYRPMTEEEEKDLCEKFGIKEGSLEDWEKKVFTCRLPDDGQEILTSFFGKYVKEDICSWDEYGCGLENNGDWDGVDAWMPKPEPYKKGGAV